MTSIQHSAFSPKMGTADQALNLPSSKPTFKPPAMVWWRFGRWRGFVSWVQENRAKSRVWLGLPGPYWRNGMRLEGSGEGVHTGVCFLCCWNCEHLDLKGKKNGRKKKFQRGISVDGKRVILVLHCKHLHASCSFSIPKDLISCSIQDACGSRSCAVKFLWAISSWHSGALTKQLLFLVSGLSFQHQLSSPASAS